MEEYSSRALVADTAEYCTVVARAYQGLKFPDAFFGLDHPLLGFVGC
jgi:hypothetical protein